MPLVISLEGEVRRLLEARSAAGSHPSWDASVNFDTFSPAVREVASRAAVVVARTLEHRSLARPKPARHVGTPWVRIVRAEAFSA